MTPDDARALVRRCLGEIAPDADLDALEDADDLRETLDLDSMDIFNLVAAIADESGVEIPDREVGRLTTLGALVERVAGAPAP
ncbi:MAG TPA: phosphopantetheine-binding protein [Baekduia sp.]|nr:phosphopantetheine-binding protein [Baekduia sp.]